MTKAQLKRYLDVLDRRIEQYLHKLAESEQSNPSVNMDRSAVESALKELQKEQKTKEEALTELESSNKNQCCFTEPDAQLMRSGRDWMVVGYNAQNAVDDQHQLIVHHELTTAHGDNQQLKPMVEKVSDVLEQRPDIIAADAGYSNGEQLAELQKQGYTTAVPANRSRNVDMDKFTKSDFKYLPETDEFRCPAGEILSYTTKSTKKISCFFIVEAVVTRVHFRINAQQLISVG